MILFSDWQQHIVGLGFYDVVYIHFFLKSYYIGGLRVILSKWTDGSMIYLIVGISNHLGGEDVKACCLSCLVTKQRKRYRKQCSAVELDLELQCCWFTHLSMALQNIYWTKKLGIMNCNQNFRVKFDMTMIFLFLHWWRLLWPPFKLNLTFLPEATTELSSVEHDYPLKWSVPKSVFQNPCLLF